LWLFAMAVAIGAIAASTVRLGRVRTAMRFRPADLMRMLGRTSGDERVRHVAAEVRAKGAAWEADLLDDVIGAAGEARVALVNEHLGDLGARLDWGRAVPFAAAHLSLALPLLALVFAVARGAHVLPSVLPTALFAGVGALASLWVGRQADRTATDLREGVDKLVERLLASATSRNPEVEGPPTGDSQ